MNNVKGGGGDDDGNAIQQKQFLSVNISIHYGKCIIVITYDNIFRRNIY